jgi:hypothetical protein
MAQHPGRLGGSTVTPLKLPNHMAQHPGRLGGSTATPLKLPNHMAQHPRRLGGSTATPLKHKITFSTSFRIYRVRENYMPKLREGQRGPKQGFIFKELNVEMGPCSAMDRQIGSD